MYKSKKYTEEQFIVAVASSFTIAEVIRKLGLSTLGNGNYSAVGRQLGVSDNAVRKRLRRYDVTVA